MKKLRLTSVIAILAVCLGASRAFSAESAQDYAKWDTFLKHHVEDGLVDYEGLAKKNGGALPEIIRNLQSVTSGNYASWNEDQKMAFWINAYNIGALKVVLDHYPLSRSFSLKALAYPAESIQQIPDVWDRPVLRLLGNEMSLNDIEHDVLREDFDDPRFHFAIVCASTSCPDLREEAYTGDKLEEQLQSQVDVFLSDPEKFRYDSNKDVAHLSPIFRWFGEDFEKAGGVLPFIRKHLPENQARGLSEKSKKVWQDYDWGLNTQ